MRCAPSWHRSGPASTDRRRYRGSSGGRRRGDPDLRLPGRLDGRGRPTLSRRPVQAPRAPARAYHERVLRACEPPERSGGIKQSQAATAGQRDGLGRSRLRGRGARGDRSHGGDRCGRRERALVGGRGEAQVHVPQADRAVRASGLGRDRLGGDAPRPPRRAGRAARCRAPRRWRRAARWRAPCGRARPRTGSRGSPGHAGTPPAACVGVPCAPAAGCRRSPLASAPPCDPPPRPPGHGRPYPVRSPYRLRARRVAALRRPVASAHGEHARRNPSAGICDGGRRRGPQPQRPQHVVHPVTDGEHDGRGRARPSAGPDGSRGADHLERQQEQPDRDGLAAASWPCRRGWPG